MTPLNDVGVIGAGKLYGYWKDLININHDLYDDNLTALPKIDDCKNLKIYIVIGCNITRKFLYNKFKNREILSTIGDVSKISQTSIIDIGALICNFACINFGCKIGQGFIMGMNSVVDANVIIGDFVRLSPMVYIGDSSIIGNGCVINANVTILPKVQLGDNVYVAAGSVVTHSFGSNLTIAGSPARIVNGNNELHKILL